MADSFRGYGYLEHLSVERLEELLDLAVNADEEENSEYIDAILEVIVKKEKESPSGRFIDINKAWNDFQTYYNTEDGRGQTLYFSEDQEQLATATPRNRKILRRIWKTALVAAVTVICLIISVVAAQAVGFDVLGALAHWTDGIFTFGNVQPPTVDMTFGETADNSAESANQTPSINTSEDWMYSSFQEALDNYSITEISEPSILPDNYVLEQISGFDGNKFYLDAMYTNGSDIMSISILSHSGNPSTQVEKGDSPVEVFETGDTIFYLVENTNNYTVVWLTEHYECFITSSLNMEKATLKEIAFSMID